MLSENIHALRRRQGLSQEQLAEQIGVSRQAVSKWETGAAVPELDKLTALSVCFHVTIDVLTGTLPPDPPVHTPVPDPSGTGKRHRRLGVVLCAAGAVCLFLMGVLAALHPAAVDHLNASSAVTLNGSGVLLLLCALLAAVGLRLMFRK